MKARKLEVAVISDLHLATHACQAKNVWKYLKSINPGILVLNGDIIDSWRFSRNYFPKAHLKVVRQIIKMLERGIHVFYVTGNHDEFLRKFSQTQMGRLKIVNQLILELDGKKTWIFHGDIFDHIIHHAKWLAKFGAATYGLLTLLNKAINQVLHLFGKKELIIYKSIKKKLVKGKTHHLSRFEDVICKIAAEREYQTVICGHTHVPCDKQVLNEHGAVRYINCGDWVEHLTAAEYADGKWSLFHFADEEDESLSDDPDFPDEKQLYHELYRELALANIG